MIKTFDAPSIVSTGTVFATASVVKKLNPIDVYVALQRHRRGDWGLVSESDHEQNDLALQNGGRLLSVFEDRKQTRFWIITEADRSQSTVLLPSDY
ncbi:hypothetical protein GCM10023156_62960 [Novipirellula rosea]|uniref:Plasmid related protein n=1 Tax=Novipirellula rosea TaxID=1031540 RepID=A0ABP8NR73_9BACT